MTKGTGAKKGVAKKVAKAVEDKTFGQKNKGGKKNQAVVKQMTSTLQGNQRKPSSNQPQSKKALKAERDAELAALGLLKAVPKKTAAAPSGGAASTSNTPMGDHQEPEEERALEDIIEEMRRNLGANLTRVTPETFAVWYAKKKKEKAEKRQKKMSKREKDIALGRVAMTGRELFERKRNVFVDDERADESTYDRDEEAAVFVASLEEQMRMDAEVNGAEFDEDKFKAERDRMLAIMKAERGTNKSSAVPAIAATTSSAPSENINVDSLASAPPIDESLFNEEDLPDDLDDEGEATDGAETEK